MARVKVKICGLTNWRDARRACEAGADFLGFNFYPGSPRYIAPAKARRIIRRLPKRIAVVGVFQDESEQSVREIARTAGLGYLQLHGDEPPAMVLRLARTWPVIKALRVGKSFRPAQLARYKKAAAFLLDGFDRHRRGGTGKTFDWKMARRAKRYGRIMIAGGLNPENVGEAVRAGNPWAVDVSSGVEAAPGKKDFVRMKAFVQAARRGARGNGK
ncbi:MAG: phosphoribosylanthranilate isomerase [Acidobacteriia bacterium]|nr:phosphoribosylanthranilate isomerase [Terriglobia bacterium]